MVVIICCACKQYIEIEDFNLVVWIQDHVEHGLLVDNTLAWYEGWLAQVGGLDGSNG